MFKQPRRVHYSPFDSHRRQGSFFGRAFRFLLMLLSLGGIAAATFFTVSSCQEKAASSHALSYASRNACEFRYEGVGLTLIENHCGASTGIYFMTPQGLYTAPLIDPAVSALVKSHGCEAPNRCVFNLQVKANSIGGQFDYLLNGREGFYSFEWPRDQQPRLVESSKTGSKS